MSHLQPVSGVARDPIAGMRAQDMRPVPVGIPISELAPQCAGLLVCRVNGEWLLRESWKSVTLPGDVIEWYEIPQDNDTLRTVLSIGAILFLGPLGLQLSGVNLIAATLLTQFALNILLPPTLPGAPARPEETGTNFSTSLSGNQARLDQPIWKTCGRREITPPFACVPYLEYRPQVDAEDPNLDNDQYYFALLAVGIGNHNVAAVKIGNTPISRFDDVLIAEYLAPGEQPITVDVGGQPVTVLANVSTAAEISGQILETGRYVGGFAACAARRTCTAIGVDVVATRGLGKTGALTVTWRVEYRQINDFGQVLSPWSILGAESRTAFTSTPQRWSVRYELPTTSRVEIRLVRTDLKDDDPAALHEIAWAGLRGYMAESAPLNEHCAHFQVVMRASSQLSENSSKDLRLIVEALTRTWSPNVSGDGWGAEVHTRNPVWWILDLAASDTWGVDKPDERIDFQSFYELAQTCDDRQDRFDWTFDSSVSAWDAMQLIARSCRSRVFRRNGVLTIARDQLADVPVTAFTPRNCMPGIQISEALRQRNSPDGIVIEYQDHRTWEWTAIDCPCPGVSEMTNPVRKRIEGVTGAKHAEREGRYEAAVLFYRRRFASWTTEMQGMLPAYMSPVDLQPDIVGYGQSGDVATWDEDELVLGLSEPPNWESGSLYITLIRDDGTLTTPVAVTPGPDDYSVTLPAAPDFTLVLDSGLRERPKYLLGPLVGTAELVKVTSVEDGGTTEDGARLYSLTGVVDDDRVHEADASLLPGPGEIQDPVGDPDDSDEGEGGGGTLPIPRLTHRSVAVTAMPVNIGTTHSSAITFQNNGLIKLTRVEGGTFEEEITDEWSAFGEIEASDAALFEIRATLLSSFSTLGTETFTGTMSTWQSLGTDRTWQLSAPFPSDLEYPNCQRNMRIEIRSADSQIVQASAYIDLQINPQVLGGG